jgi:hypothetical protein
VANPTLSPAHRLRRAVNWLNLTTPAGLAVAKLGRAEFREGPDGLILAEGYRWPFPTGGAFTIGNVVTTRGTFDDLARRFPHVLRHEAVHASQYAALGLFFWPLYAATVGWSLARTGDRAARSAFERQAGLADGGYQDVPVRPLSPAVILSAPSVILSAAKDLYHSAVHAVTTTDQQ